MDLLAANYGWQKNYIFYEVYPDEFVLFTKAIKKRQFAEYQVQLAIAQNPHSKNPKVLWETLESEVREAKDPEMDEAGIERLKLLMSGNPRFVVK